MKDFYFELQRFDDPVAVSSLEELTAKIEYGKLTANVTLSSAITLTDSLSITDFDSHTITGTINVPAGKTLKIGSKVVTAGTGSEIAVALSGSDILTIKGLDTGKSVTYNNGTTTTTYTNTNGFVVDGTTVYGVDKDIDVTKIGASNNPSELFKITGTKSGATGLTLESKQIKVAADALGTGEITLTGDDYTLALDGYNEPTPAWTKSNKSATYDKTDVYKVADEGKSITYTAKENVVSISGLTTTVDADALKNHLTVDSTGKTITIKKNTDLLASGFTVDTTGYTIAFDAGDDTKVGNPELSGEAVSASGTSTVNITGTWSAGYYLKDASGKYFAADGTRLTSGKTVEYSAQTNTVLAKITNLTGITAENVGTAVTLDSTDKTKVTVVSDYLTTSTTTTKFATLKNEKQPDKTTDNTYKFAAVTASTTTNPTAIAQSNGTGAAPANVDVWSVSGTTATYKTVVPAYYKITGTNATTISYTAQADVQGGPIGTITNLASGLKAYDEYDSNNKKWVSRIGKVTTTTENGTTTTTYDEAITATKGTENEGKTPYTFTVNTNALPEANKDVTLTAGSNTTGSKFVLADVDNATTNPTKQALDTSNNSGGITWAVSGTKVTLSANLTKGSVLDANNTTIHCAAAGSTKLFEISGLKSGLTVDATTKTITGITLEGKANDKPIGEDKDTEDGKISVTLDNTVLNGKDVTITSGTDSFTYDLKLDTTATSGKEVLSTSGEKAGTTDGTVPDKVKIWTFKSGTATYKSVQPAYYAVNKDGNVTYVAQTSETTLATITGLSTNVKVSDDGTKLVVDVDGEEVQAVEVVKTDGKEKGFKLNSLALNSKDVTLTNGTQDGGDKSTYSLSLDTTGTNQVTEPTEVAKWWTVKNGTATLYDQISDGYTLGEEDKTSKLVTSIVYSKAVAKKELATVTGLSSDVKALKQDGTAAATSGDAVKEGVKLGIAKDGDTPAVLAHTAMMTTTADDKTTTSVGTSSNDTFKKITLTDAMLAKKDVTLTDKDSTDNDKNAFELAFKTDASNESLVTSETATTEAWRISSTTATRVQYQAGYYTLTDAKGVASTTTVTYHKDGSDTKLFELKGLASGKKYVADGANIKVGNDVVATVDTSTSGSEKVKLADAIVGTKDGAGITLEIATLANNTENKYKDVTLDLADGATKAQWENPPTWSVNKTTATLTKKIATASDDGDDDDDDDNQAPNTEQGNQSPLVTSNADTNTKPAKKFGIELSSDGKKAIYHSADVKLLEVTGLRSGLDAAEQLNSSTTANNVITYTPASGEVKLFAGALFTTNVALKSLDGGTYKLALDSGVPTQTTENGTIWTLTEKKSGNVTTATVTAKKGKTEYYTLDETKNTVTYGKPVSSKDLFTITGLKADDSLTLDALKANNQALITFIEPSGSGANATAGTVTVHSDYIPTTNGAKVTLTSKDYVFAALSDEGVKAATFGTASWVKTGDTDAKKKAADKAELTVQVTAAGSVLSLDKKTLTYLTSDVAAQGGTDGNGDGTTTPAQGGGDNLPAGSNDETEKTHTILTISGVKNVDATTLASQIDVNGTNKTLTVSKDILGTSTISMTGNTYGFTFELDGGVAKEATSSDGFFDVTVSNSGSTATYKKGKTHYYEAKDESIVYHKPADTTTLFTVSGLSSDVTLANADTYLTVTAAAKEGENATVTVKAEALGDKEISIKGTGYELALENASKANLQTPVWTYDPAKGTITITAKYVQPTASNGDVVEGNNEETESQTPSAGGDYAIKGGKIVKVDRSKEVTLATISGLTKNLTLGTAITESKDGKSVETGKYDVTALAGAATDTAFTYNSSTGAIEFKSGNKFLGTSAITLSSDYGYTIDVATDVNSENETEDHWEVKNGTATYRTVIPKKYEVDEKSNGTKITYTPEKVQGKALATIKNLNTDGTWEEVYTNTETPASLSFTPKKKDTDTEDPRTVASVISISGDDETKEITLKASALAEKNVTLTADKYKLKLDGGVTNPIASSYTWLQKANDTKATITAVMAAGYTLTDDKTITYSAASTKDKPTTILTISGLKKNETKGTGNDADKVVDVNVTYELPASNTSGGTGTGGSGESGGTDSGSGDGGSGQSNPDVVANGDAGSTPADAWAGFKTKLATDIGNKVVIATSDADDDGNTYEVVKLDNDILDAKKVTMSLGKGQTGYQLGLNDEQHTDAIDLWSFKGGTATYKNATPAYYTVDTTSKNAGLAINYTAEGKGTEKFSISGLNKDLEAYIADTNGDVTQTIIAKNDNNHTAVISLDLNEENPVIKLRAAAIGTVTNDLPKLIKEGSTPISLTIKKGDKDFANATLAFDTADETYNSTDKDKTLLSKDADEGAEWNLGTASNTAVYKELYTAGLKVLNNGTKIGNVKAGETVYATLTGIDLSEKETEVKTALSKDSKDDDKNTALDAIKTYLNDTSKNLLTVDEDENTITIAKELFGTSNITVKKGTESYTLALGDGVLSDAKTAEGEASDVWKLKGKGTAVFENVIPAYYTVDAKTGTTIKYNAAKTNKTYVTVSGLNTDIVEEMVNGVNQIGYNTTTGEGDNAQTTFNQGIEFDKEEGVITLTSKAMLGEKKATLKKGADLDGAGEEGTTYTFAFKNGVNFAPNATLTWKYDTKGTATLTSKVGDEDNDTGYTLSGNKQEILFSKKGEKADLIKLTGLKKPDADYEGTGDTAKTAMQNNGVTVNDEEGTVTLSSAILGGANIAISGTAGYSVALNEDDDNIPMTDTEVNSWFVSGKTATYKRVKQGYYSAGKADKSGNVKSIVFKKAVDVKGSNFFTLGGVTLDKGQSLVAGTGDNADKLYLHTAAVMNEDGSVKTKATEVPVATIDDDSKTVTIHKSDILPTDAGKSISVTTKDGNYSVVLDENDTTLKEYKMDDAKDYYFVYEKNSIILKAPYQEGYEISGGKLTKRNATELTLATVSGIKLNEDKIKAENVTVDRVTTNVKAALDKLGLSATYADASKIEVDKDGVVWYDSAQTSLSSAKTIKTAYEKDTAATEAAKFAAQSAKYLEEYISFEATEKDDVFNGGTITVSAEILSNSTVSVKGAIKGEAYALVGDGIARTAESVTETWSVSNGTATKMDFKMGYYTPNSNNTQLVYTKAGKADKTYATLSGLNSNFNGEIEESGGVVTLTKEMVGEKNITIKNGKDAGDDDYTIELDSTVVTKPEYTNGTWKTSNKTSTYTSEKTSGYFTLKDDAKTATYTKATTKSTEYAKLTGSSSAITPTVDGTTVTIDSVDSNDTVTIDSNGGMDFKFSATSGTLVGSKAADTIKVTGSGVTVDGGAGNDIIDLGTGGNVTYRFTKGGGNDVVENFGSSGDKFMISDSSVKITKLALSSDEEDLIITLSGGKVTLKGVGGDAESLSFTYVDSENKSHTVDSKGKEETAESSDLVASSDLLFDDNFVSNAELTISELVNTSIDNYSLGGLNATRQPNGISEQNDLVFATFGNEQGLNEKK